MKPKILFFDIETSPLLTYVWGLFEQNVALNQIHTDWHVLSWAARWAHDPAGKVMYRDQRKAKNIEDDKVILRELWTLLNEADIVVTQNGKAFDQKKLNARFVIHGFQPPATYKHIDTFLLAKKHFGFTSNKLEYMTNKLNKKYKKLKHEKFAGFDLWKECLAGNLAAWREMEKYNKHDVLALEELYHKLVPWDSSINFTVYRPGADHVCSCGSEDVERRGYHYTATGKFQRFQCRKCGAWSRSRLNLFTEARRQRLRVGVKP